MSQIPEDAAVERARAGVRSASTAAVAAVIAATVLAACSDNFGADLGEGVRGSGNLLTETRVVSGFDEIVLFGSGIVFVDITGSESLRLEAEDNLVPLITTRVTGGRLELSVVPNTNLQPTEDITFTITASELHEITVMGSADIEVTDVDSAEFGITINGSGNVSPFGTTERLGVTINGSGDFDGPDLMASIGEVAINGSGSVVINATDELTARIAGSGNVRYVGDPVVDEIVTGSGSVSPR